MGGPGTVNRGRPVCRQGAAAASPQNGGGRANYNSRHALVSGTTTPVMPRGVRTTAPVVLRPSGAWPRALGYKWAPAGGQGLSRLSLPPSCGAAATGRLHPPPSAAPAAARPPGLSAAPPHRHEGQVAQEANAQAEAQEEEDEAKVQVDPAAEPPPPPEPRSRCRGHVPVPPGGRGLAAPGRGCAPWRPLRRE